MKWIILSLFAASAFADFTLRYKKGEGVVYRSGGAVVYEKCLDANPAARGCSGRSNPFSVPLSVYRARIASFYGIAERASASKEGVERATAGILEIEKKFDEGQISKKQEADAREHLAKLRSIQNAWMRSEEEVIRILEKGRDRSLDIAYQEKMLRMLEFGFSNVWYFQKTGYILRVSDTKMLFAEYPKACNWPSGLWSPLARGFSSDIENSGILENEPAWGYTTSPRYRSLILARDPQTNSYGFKYFEGSEETERHWAICHMKFDFDSN